MNKVKNILNRPFLVFSIIALFGLYWVFFQFNYSQPNAIAGDGLGYYKYLPNTFIYSNLDSQKPDGRYIQEAGGKGVNKYYVGTAVSMSPFFLLGHGIANIIGEKTDGFSYPYHWSISFAGLLFLLGGAFFFIKFLKLFSFSNWIISISLLMLIFGTNLFAYAFLMPSMSHVYSFFWITGFLYLFNLFFQTQQAKHLYWAIFFFAMLVLVRPVNGIILFALPFFTNSFADFKTQISSFFTLKSGSFSLIILMSVLFTQSLFWFLQTRHWWVWSYGNEGFIFTNPHWIEFLFGFRKGVLIYTPILFISIAGLGVLIRKNKYKGLGFLFFFGTLVYVLSSWWNWYYGPSFSQRPLVEFYGLSFLLVAYFFQSTKTQIGFQIVGALASFLVLLNLVQTYQYQKGIISSWDMNQEKYVYSFLKTGENYKNTLGGNDDILPYKPKIDTVFSEKMVPSQPRKGIEIGKSFTQGDFSVIDYTDTEFNFALSLFCNEAYQSKRGVYIMAELEIQDFETSHKNEALFVVDITDSSGNNIHYGTFPIRSIPPRRKGKWIKENYSIEIQKNLNPADKIKLYIWNKEKETFWVKNLKIEVLTIN